MSIRRHFLILLMAGLTTPCNVVFAADKACDETLVTTVKITSSSPVFTAEQIQEVVDVTLDVAKNIYAEFEFPTGLSIRLLDKGKPVFSPFTNSIRTPFDFATTFLKPNAKRVAKYWEHHSPRFRAKGIYLHELGHAFQFIAFKAAIPQYREFYQRQTQFLERFPEVAELMEHGDIEFELQMKNSKVADAVSLFLAKTPLQTVIRPTLLARPYDELFADLAPALETEDANIFLKDDRLIWEAESGQLIVFLLGWTEKSNKHRSFKTKYESNQIEGVASEHNVLGPSRSHVWQLYLRNKDRISKSRFMRLVFDAAVAEINDRIASNRFIDFGVRIEDRVILQEVDSLELNESFIARLNRVEWR